MQQVIVIHGGDSFRTRRQYLQALKRWPVSLNAFLPGSDWKAGLPRALGRSYQVLLPKMPNKSNARFDEWKIWFERMFPYLRHNVILVGHSLGGTFLAKYLSENKFPKKIKALILVAAAHNNTSDIGDFRLTRPVSKVTKQSRQIFLIHSQDDPIVPFFELKKFRQDFPAAETRIFKNRGHFNQRQFPEIVRLIKKI